MTEFVIIDPAPIVTLSPIVTEPLSVTEGPKKVSFPIDTLWPTIELVPITIFLPIEVFDKIPREIVTLDDIRTLSPMTTDPICGISKSVSSSDLKVAMPVTPIKEPGPIRTEVPRSTKSETHAGISGMVEKLSPEGKKLPRSSEGSIIELRNCQKKRGKGC